MSTRKHILILTMDAGFGHRSAANAVAAALEELHGDECALDIVNPLEDERVPGLLRSGQTDYDKMMRDLPDLYKMGYQAAEKRLTSRIVERTLGLMLYEVIRDIVRKRRPSAIITTYPLYQPALARVLGRRRRRICMLNVITDIGDLHRLWFNSAADYCLVPTPEARDLALQQGLRPEAVRVTGIPVSPLLAGDRRSKAQVRAELGWQPGLTTVLAVGSKRVLGMTDHLRALNHSGLPLQLAIVAGGDDEAYAELQRVGWHIPAIVYNYTRDMPALLLAADAVLCKAGGLIVTESLAAGLPLVLIEALPGNEEANAAYVVGGGAAERSDSPLETLEVLYHWLANGGRLLADRAAAARRLGRPRAAYDVAELAWECVT